MSFPANGRPAKTLLVVDDEAADRLFIENSLRENGVADHIFSFPNGREAIRYLAGEGEYADRAKHPYPSIVITDLKSDPEYAIMPVLVLSSSDDADDVKWAYRMGAASFMRKPQGLDELKAALKAFYDYWRLCVLPEVDAAGRQVMTEFRGKLGERFGQI